MWVVSFWVKDKVPFDAELLLKLVHHVVIFPQLKPTDNVIIR